MTDRPMAFSEFVNLLDVHGSSIDVWPEDRRVAAQSLLQGDIGARRLFDKQAELDSTLERFTVPEFSGLAQKISNQVLPPRKLSVVDQLIEWLIPRRAPGLWRPAVAACLPLMFGLMIGNYSSFGISEDSLADEAWSEELYILALNEYDQSL